MPSWQTNTEGNDLLLLVNKSESTGKIICQVFLGPTEPIQVKFLADLCPVICVIYV
jgi:hypothetical protein